jgi:hypothetical protein
MLASTIQFTNTHPRPLPTARAATTTPHPAGETGEERARGRCDKPRRTREPTRENTTGPPTPAGHKEPGLFPQDPTARRHPHTPAGRPGPPGDHTNRHPNQPRRDQQAHTREAGKACDVSTHEQPSPPRSGGMTATNPGPAPKEHPPTTGGRGVGELLRKEVIQPHLPVRLPCYDFVPIASPTFDHSLPLRG